MTEEIKAKAIAAGEASEGNKIVFRFDFGDGKLAKNVTQVIRRLATRSDAYFCRRRLGPPIFLVMAMLRD
jgi:hypothetical protein